MMRWLNYHFTKEPHGAHLNIKIDKNANIALHLTYHSIQSKDTQEQ